LQADEAVAAGVAEFVVRTRDVPSSDIDMFSTDLATVTSYIR
jgi:hypothetical protein